MPQAQLRMEDHGRGSPLRGAWEKGLGRHLKRNITPANGKKGDEKLHPQTKLTLQKEVRGRRYSKLT